MKASIIASTLALASSALAYPGAAPPTPLFTIQLANDISGANAIRSVPANGIANTFINVFANTVLVKGGVIMATSLQNVAPGGTNINCVVNKADGTFVGNVNNQKTFLDLDGIEGRAVEVDASAFTIKCNPQ
ncbi:uncharacterized protein M421DRAFT_90338 [Didymella exigua CBS 183.55]|uniref:Pectate lyase n=1 Tax=Didymella exigua CBS 183.55 TaxID=1150837 RepID=A0A6A5RUU0_9PLEO|nr:uncharacterized protein M421DRAFT_90338 [Didymella exigua CBS 183.55]KAF1931263.1 hypothetical protein M421DRAFT_90338 [Didymella exigua CBS 183.55]